MLPAQPAQPEEDLPLVLEAPRPLAVAGIAEKVSGETRGSGIVGLIVGNGLLLVA